MTNTVVGGASLEITIDLAKFATQARTQLVQALSSSSMRDAITSGLNSASSNAGIAGQSAATKFATGVTEGTSTLVEAGAKAGQAVTEGLTAGVDTSVNVLREAGTVGGTEFATAVGAAAASAGDALAAGTLGSDAEITALYDSIGTDAGVAYTDAVTTAIDAGTVEVTDAATLQGDTVDQNAGNALADAGSAAGASFVDATTSSVKKLTEKAAPIVTTEAAKLGVESGTKLSEAGKEAGGKFGEGVTGSVKGLASSLGPIIGVLGAGELVKSSLEAADQLEGANIKIENVFGHSGEQVRKWASGVADSLGMSQLAAENTAGQFGAYLSGLGVGKDKAAGLSEQLVGLSANIASFNNADPATVQEALTSALRGRTTALKQYGVTLTSAQINQEAMAHASELGNIEMKNGEPVLNSQQKALATLYAVMDATANQQGAVAANSETLRARQQQATAEFANMRAELGTALTPVLVILLGVINQDIIPALTGLGHWISSNSEWLKPLAIAIGGAALGFKAAGLASKLWLEITKGAAIVTKGWAAAQVLLNLALDANPIVLIVLGVLALVAAIVIAYRESGTFRDIVKAAWEDIKTAFSVAWGIIKAIFDIWLLQWKLIIAGVLAAKDWIVSAFNDVVGFFSGLPGRIAGIAVSLFDSVKNAMTNAKNWIGDRIEDVLGFFGGIGGRLAALTSGMFDGIKNAFRGAINWLIRGWNSLHFHVPGFSIPGIGGVGDFDIGLGHINEIAQGATILPRPGGTLARLAEAGKSETVVDTGLMNKVLTTVSKQLDNRPATQIPAGGVAVTSLDPDSMAAIMALANRPVILQVGQREIARAANTGNKQLARIR